MRNNWMREICLILCMVLCLSFSAMASDGEVAMGRYIEVPIKLPFEGYLSFAYAGGTIYYIDENGDTLFYCTNLDEWDVNNIGHDEQNPPAQGHMNGLTVSTDGTLWLSSGSMMLNEDGYPYLDRVMDGKSERVQLDRKLDTDTDRLILCALPSGELLGLNEIEAYRFSADGTTKQKYAVPGGEAMALYGNEVAICSTSNSLITILDIESGQVLRTLPLPSGVSYGLSQIGYDAKGALYYVGPDGLYQSNAGSTMMMQIADGRLMTVSKPSVEAWALLFDQENNPVIAYSQGGGISLIQYRYDENVTTEPGTILSVFTLYDSGTLRECANQFQLKYPDVMVDITAALPKGTAITRDDAIRTLNTEMLAGKGPDVLVLDGLPVQSYIDKDVLQDLSGAVQPMIDSGELQDSLVSAFKRDGTIPAVPTRFLLTTIWGEIDGMKTIEDLANWNQNNPDTLPYYAIDLEPLISTFYLSCAPSWFTEDGRLAEEKIEAFLSSMKAIRGKWTYEDSVQKTGWDFKNVLILAGKKTPEWNPYDTNNIGRYGLREESGGGQLMIQGLQKHLPFLLRGGDSATLPVGILENIKANGIAALPGQTEGCFVPTLMMGASKGTTNSEVALQFIAYALSEAAQRVDIWEGFPVNLKALDAMRTQKNTSSGVLGGGIDWIARWPDQDQRDHLRGIIDGLKTPVVVDFTLYQMIVQESTPFFNGEIDAKQAAANVCAKANAYLSE